MALFTGHTITPDSALGGTQIQRSLRFAGVANNSISRTPSSTGNQKVWTWSCWFKRTKLGDGSYNYLLSSYGNNDGIAAIYFDSSDRINTYYDTSGSNPYGAVNERRYRVVGAWMHIVWQVDAINTTQRIWINGVEESLSSSYNPPNFAYTMNQSGQLNTIGGAAWYPEGTGNNNYLAEIHFSDGSKYAASEFGYTDAQTGEWRPKNGNVIKSTITYGTNGYWIDFRDNTSTTTLGYDYSGNGNHWTLNNMSVAAGAGNDSLEDTPTNNFPIINTLSAYSTNFVVPTNGGLDFSLANSHYAISSIEIPTSGKWYAECVFTTVESGDFGVFNPNMLQDDSNGFDGRWNGIRMTNSGSNSYIATDNTEVQSSLTAISNGAIVGLKIDRDAGTVAFTINGSANGTPVLISSMTDSSALVIRAGRDSSSGSNPVGSINFGQRPFSHLPTGYRSLSSKNRATPSPASVVRPQRFFDTILYTGQDTSSLYNVTGLEFAPDLVWAKARTDTIGHIFIDTVRGDDKQLEGNITDAEVTRGTPSYRFLKDGFAVSTGGNMNNPVNYVAWCWKAGGAAVTNTVGNISAQVSANDEAGCSIITYTGDGNTSGNVGTGLRSTQPLDWAIVKRRDNTSDWQVGHRASGQSSNFAYHTNLNDYSALDGSTPYHMGTQNYTNGDRLYLAEGGLTSSATYVAYVWQERPGYSKFGSYTGNGNSNGAFIHLGFKPAYFAFKGVHSDSWYVYDNKRDPINPVDKELNFHTTQVEASSHDIDFLHNGVKMRNSNSSWNYNNYTYMYMAFAEQPSETMFGLDANAR